MQTPIVFIYTYNKENFGLGAIDLSFDPHKIRNTTFLPFNLAIQILPLLATTEVTR